MCTLSAFVFLLLNEIIIAPTSEECCKNPENASNVLQQCLAHTAYQQPLCLVLFTHSLQQPLAIASASSTPQREACTQSQRLAQDYTSSENAPTIPTQVFPRLNACCSFRAASFSRGLFASSSTSWWEERLGRLTLWFLPASPHKGAESKLQQQKNRIQCFWFRQTQFLSHVARSISVFRIPIFFFFFAISFQSSQYISQLITPT